MPALDGSALFEPPVHEEFAHSQRLDPSTSENSQTIRVTAGSSAKTT